MTDRLETRIKAVLETAKGPMSNATLAEYTGKHPRHISRLLNPDNQCKLSSYAQALRALGYEMEFIARAREVEQ